MAGAFAGALAAGFLAAGFLAAGFFAALGLAAAFGAFLAALGLAAAFFACSYERRLRELKTLVLILSERGVLSTSLVRCGYT